MPITVWIPADTPARYRALLPSSVIVWEVPGDPLPPTLGHGDFLVADFNVARIREIIPRLEGLRVVQSPAAGVDALLEAIPAGVTLCDGAGIHDVPVAEWVVMALLAMAHNLPEFVEAQTRGEWHRTGPAAGGDDLEGSTVLIVGHGSIGGAVEARLTPFGVKFLRVARHPREGIHSLADLPTLLPQADVVLILLPLTPETRKLVDARFFSAMRPGALFMNPARGAIVDTEALTAALTAGRIQAALDVTDPEPLPKGHPLWSAPGVLITPHVASSVTKFYDRAWQLIADQVRRFAAREPLRNLVVDGY